MIKDWVRSPVDADKLALPDPGKGTILCIERVIHSAGEADRNPAIAGNPATAAVGPGFVSDH